MNNSFRFKQIFGLLFSTFLTIPIGIITSVFLTRFLGAEQYGDYSLITSIFNFAVVVFTFGIFQASNRALVLNSNNSHSREYYGATLLLTVGLFLIMCLFLFIYGFFDVNLKQKFLQKIFITTIPSSIVFLFVNYFENLFQADNQIKLLSQSRLLPKVLFGFSIFFLFLFYNEIFSDKLLVVWIIFFITHLCAFAYIIFRIDVSFNNLKIRIEEILNYNRSYGFNVYIGSLFSVGFSSITNLLISYYGISNSGVGYYSLALVLSTPLSFIPNIIATTHYKEFSESKQISNKLLFITLLLSLLALMIIWLIVPIFIYNFYGEEYLPVIELSFIISIGTIVHGFGDFFNRFLGANGRGKELRNSSFFVGIAVLIASLMLIPKLGELGAAYVKVIAGLVYFFTIYFYYYIFKIKENS